MPKKKPKKIRKPAVSLQQVLTAVQDSHRALQSEVAFLRAEVERTARELRDAQLELSTPPCEIRVGSNILSRRDPKSASTNLDANFNFMVVKPGQDIRVFRRRADGSEYETACHHVYWDTVLVAQDGRIVLSMGMAHFERLCALERAILGAPEATVRLFAQHLGAAQQPPAPADPLPRSGV